MISDKSSEHTDTSLALRSVQETREVFVRQLTDLFYSTSPNFNFSQAAKNGIDCGALNNREADDLATRGSVPDWLSAKLSSSDLKYYAHSQHTSSSLILDRYATEVNPPHSSHVTTRRDLTAGFVKQRLKSNEVYRLEGGKSTHYVANFRKLAWTSDGLIPEICTTNGLILKHFLDQANANHLQGHTLMAVVEGSVVYTHWLLDTLPRLLLLVDEGCDLTQFDNFVFATINQNFHKTTLASLGIPLDRVHTRQVEGNLFHVDSFTYVSEPRLNFVASPKVYDLVRHFFCCDLHSEKCGRRLFISRSKASRRRIVNELELMEFLRTYDFETISLEDLTIKETARVMSEASHIVAPHGAGLANLIFTSKGTRVLEIFSTHISREYWTICNQRDLLYFSFEACSSTQTFADSSNGDSMSFLERNGCDIEIPMKAFKNYFKNNFMR